MKVLLWAYTLACASAAQFQLPACSSNRCSARDDIGHDIDDGWYSNDYLVDGKRMSVATHADAIRWTCWGSDPTSFFAPHFSKWLPFIAKKVELINCTIPSMSYKDLFEKLTVSSKNVKTLTISTQPQYIQRPSMGELQEYNVFRNENEPPFARNSLQYLSLRGVPMSVEQLMSINGIRTLKLVDTGLPRVVNLSEFSELYQLELHEPMLEDAQLLGTAPALEELVLRAPDAGLAPMPLLRMAIFLDVYITGSIFGDCKKLEELTIQGGDLDHISEHWLAGCTNLTSLNLTRLQYLRNLPHDLLSDTTNLRLLDLSHNSLESLPEGLFTNTKHLTFLNLRDNSLKALSSDLLPPPTYLKYACVAGNRQTLDRQLEHFSWARKLYSGHCDNWFQ